MLFNTASEILAGAIRQEKEMEGTEIGEEEVKLSLCEDGVLYIEESGLHQTTITIQQSFRT